MECFILLHNKYFRYLAVLASFAIPASLAADIVFLKDGKILEGVKILVASGNKIKIRNAENKEEIILRENIKRLRYGEDTVESTNILLNNGNIIRKAYIVEQSSSRVLIRRD